MSQSNQTSSEDSLVDSQLHFSNKLPIFVLFVWLLGTMLLWWFAFYDGSGSEQPDWLERARAACFGTDVYGLPNAGGWLLLTLAPLLFLICLIVALGEDLRNGLSSLSRTWLGAGLLIVIAIFTAAHAAWAANEVIQRQKIANASELPFQTGVFPDNYPRTYIKAPEFSLVNYLGENISLTQFKGKSVILTFAFAHCQTVCPTLISSAKSALAGFQPEEVQLIVITIDPWRDTPSALQSIHEKWDLPENAVVLSGTEEEIQSVLTDYNYTSTRNEKTGDVVHPAMMYIVSPSGDLSYTLNNPSSQWLTQAITKVQLAPSFE